MQEALQKLGFYSGEEDMEYSSFSSGTERAVKTWQVSIALLHHHFTIGL
uniref:Peptidoglycan binding-like domain-containing protein n=1 Tax=Arundo donax TaxID=35708 RepID=A0A0A9DA51_ARUDO